MGWMERGIQRVQCRRLPGKGDFSTGVTIPFPGSNHSSAWTGKGDANSLTRSCHLFLQRSSLLMQSLLFILGGCFFFFFSLAIASLPTPPFPSLPTPTPSLLVCSLSPSPLLLLFSSSCSSSSPNPPPSARLCAQPWDLGGGRPLDRV